MEVTEKESMKPEYVYRPSFFFHAENDEQAKARASRLRAQFEGAVELSDGQLPHLHAFTYEQAWNEEDSLAERIHWAVDDDGNDRRYVT